MSQRSIIVKRELSETKGLLLSLSIVGFREVCYSLRDNKESLSEKTSFYTSFLITDKSNELYWAYRKGRVVKRNEFQIVSNR